MEKITRKSQFDSLLKKTKAKIFKTIHESLKKCLISSFKLSRLPQTFITNIKIEFNKTYMTKTVLEIYQEHEIIYSVDEFFQNKFVKEERSEIFTNFLLLTFQEVYEYYITSKQYQIDRIKIKEKEGEKFSLLFAYIAQNFSHYYNLSKGNKPKKKPILIPK